MLEKKENVLLGKVSAEVDKAKEFSKAKNKKDTVDALRTGAAAMKAMQKATNIGDVDKTMDEINEQTETMKEIQNALANPIGGFDFDEDELEAELEELEELELEEQILDTETTYPVPPVHVPQ
ncbi:vacuolar protein sorting-associated protein 32 homolog 1-like, partial [Papaver somniferum]|uniref:vacuolar protein sorting-associated protein 32 homolog 1-like n=1 Tax=Papaver somniferum TaxID=3469 RepID=UPI000E6FB19A